MKSKIQLGSVSQLFTTGEKPQTMNSGDSIQYLPLNQLHEFKEHPFNVNNDAEMKELTDSIKENGIHTPAIVRPRPDGGYELISGHRRHMAAGLAGLNEMPVIVRDYDNDMATIIMVDSNSQRSVSVIEKARAYKMKYEAMKRIAGRPSKDKENLDHSGQDLKGKSSRQLLAEVSDDSSTTIQRYLQIASLDPGLQELADKEQLGFVAAAELSALGKDEQKMLCEVLESSEKKPTKAQAFKLKEASLDNELTEKKMMEILEPTKDKPFARKVSFDDKVLSKYFPPKFTPKQIQDQLLKILDEYFSRQKESKVNAVQKKDELIR